MTATKYLFVYGTLMNGMNASRLLSGMGATFVTRAVIQGQLYDLGKYPAVVKTIASEDIVVGELYEVADAAAISQLDQYEGYLPGNPSSLFVREVTTAKRSDTGKEAAAWVYFYNPDRSLRRAKRIETGDYTRSVAT